MGQPPRWLAHLMPAGLGQQAPSLKFMAMQALKELQALPGREVVLQCAAAHGGFCQGQKKKYYLLKIPWEWKPNKMPRKITSQFTTCCFPVCQRSTPRHLELLPLRSAEAPCSSSALRLPGFLSGFLLTDPPIN